MVRRMEKPPTAKSPKSAPAKSGKRENAKLFDRPRGGAPRSIADLMPDIGRAAFKKFGFV